MDFMTNTTLIKCLNDYVLGTVDDLQIGKEYNSTKLAFDYKDFPAGSTIIYNNEMKVLRSTYLDGKDYLRINTLGIYLILK